jgi:hypothetical protein
MDRMAQPTADGPGAAMTAAGQGRSILTHLQDHLPAAGGPGLTPSGYRLPNEEPPAEGGLRWAPGALRAVLGRAPGPLPDPARALALLRAARRPWRARRARRALSCWAAGPGAEEVLGGLLAHLAAEPASPRARRKDAGTARWLAFEGTRCGPVKLGIALLSLGHDPVDREQLLVLARHDEFSTLVRQTLTAAGGDAGAAAFAVAQVATGWGRVRAVEALHGTTDPAYQRWLVCGGYHAAGLSEYTAIDAAWADLRGQLERAGAADHELIDGAVDVLRTLLRCRLEGGPSSHIGDYADAADALPLLFSFALGDRVRFADHALATDATAWLLGWNAEEDSEPISADQRAALIAQAAAVVAARDWTALAIAALDEPAHPEFELAEQLAAAAGHDTFPALLMRLDHGPGAGCSWGRTARAAGPGRIEFVVARAEQRLILTGRNEFGSMVEPAALEVIAALPAQRPGLGWPLVAAALLSRDWHRRTAYRALERWGPAGWPPAAAPALHALRRTVTDGDELARIGQLLDRAR